MKNDFVIVCGGNIKDEYCTKKNILKLTCNDKYQGLPEKVIKAFGYLISNHHFDKYNQFIKLDDDANLIKRFDTIEHEYFGVVCKPSFADRTWHMNRNTGTFWDKMPYQGEICDWCMGGLGYGVSRKALNAILPNFEYGTHIYEDMFIALLLNKKGIFPYNINMSEYFSSPEHGYVSGSIIFRKKVTI